MGEKFLNRTICKDCQLSFLWFLCVFLKVDVKFADDVSTCVTRPETTSPVTPTASSNAKKKPEKEIHAKKAAGKDLAKKGAGKGGKEILPKKGAHKTAATPTTIVLASASVTNEISKATTKTGT